MPEAACFNYTLYIRSIELQWQFFNYTIHQILNIEHFKCKRENMLQTYLKGQTGKTHCQKTYIILDSMN